MPTIFISHSSRDKGFARRLAETLIERGHEPWLDEWEIKVGESITSKIEEGLSSADFVAVVLTVHSVESKWVDREWKAKYWVEVNQDQVTVLPLLVEDCEIPTLLKDKKYADFRNEFACGVLELIHAVDPVAEINSAALNIDEQFANAVGHLLARAHADEPLSLLLVDVMQFARTRRLKELYNFCHGEVRGYHDEDTTTDEKSQRRPYRVIEYFASKTGPINPNYFEVNTASGMFNFIERNSDKFVPVQIIDNDGIAECEHTSRSQLPTATALHLTRPLGSFNPHAPNPEQPIHMYARPDSYSGVIQSIRRHLIQMLVTLLPNM